MTKIEDPVIFPDIPAEEDVVPAPRSRQRLSSRAKLLIAARQLFVERGYHDTRPQDIARLANVGHGTFYLHFPDKRDCFFAFVDEACDELEQAVEEALGDVPDLETRIERILSAVIDYHLDNPGVLSTAFCIAGVIAPEGGHRVKLLSRWADSWSQKLAQFAESGVVYDDYDFAIIGWAIVGLFNPICTAQIVDRDSREPIIANMKRLLVRGLVL